MGVSGDGGRTQIMEEVKEAECRDEVILVVATEAKTVWQIPAMAGRAVVRFRSACSPNSAAYQPHSPPPVCAHLVEIFPSCFLPV